MTESKPEVDKVISNNYKMKEMIAIQIARTKAEMIAKEI